MSRFLESILTVATGDRDVAEGLLGDLLQETPLGRDGEGLPIRVVLTALAVATTFAYARLTRTDDRSIPRPGTRDSMINVLIQEMRAALKLPFRSPGFAVAAVVTLALGIGANTAIFSLVNAVVLQPLPYPAPERLVRVWPGEAMTKGWVMTFEEGASFDALAGVSWASGTLSGTGRPMELRGGEVTVQFFDVTGVAPLHGRTFVDDDHAVGSEPTVILSHDLWANAFGADPGVVGALVDLADDEVGSRRVVGVMPADYQPLYEPWQFWVPVVIDPKWDYPGSQMSATAWNMIARLSDDATLETASAEIALLGAQIQESAPDRMAETALSRAVAVPLLEDMVSDERRPLALMLGAVGLLLLIACTNVANLLLARGEHRRRELAIRSALGASRRRLAAQLLSESLVLALLGGAAGIATAYGAIAFFRRDLIELMPRGGDVTIDVYTLAFAVLASVLASVLFGMLPALRAQGSADDGRHSQAPEQQRANRTLVAVEVAMAIVLLAGAGLMLRTLSAFGDVDPGFEAAGIVAVGINAVGERYDDPYALHGFYVEVEEDVAAIPGITSMAFTMSLPFGDGSWGWNYTIDTEELAEGAPMPNAGYRVVSTGYFDTLGIPLLAGRLMDADDVHGAEEVIVVNDAFARRHFDRLEDAVGRTVTLNTGDSFRVVGVVRGIRHLGFRFDPVPEMYRPFAQNPTRLRHVVARTAAPAETLGRAIQSAVWEIDPDLPVTDAATMNEVMRTSVREARLFTQLLGVFAMLGALLAAIGVYSVVAYTVGRRRRAIAISMALGASASSVVRRSLREALAPVLVGAVLGIAGAAAAGGLLSSQLFGVTPRDPITLTVVPLALFAIAWLAAWVPSRRAARVDPAEVLRQE